MTPRRFTIPATVFALGIAVPQWSDAQTSASPVRSDMLVSTEWLASHLDDPKVVVLHAAANRKGYDQGHIPGARFVAVGDVAQERDGVLNELPPVSQLTALVRRLGIDEGKRIVVYDETDGISAARAYVAFDYLGLGDRASLLNGHWPKWQREKRPVTKDVPEVQPTTYEPRVRPGVVVDMKTLQDLVKAKAATKAGPPIIDVRSPAEYAGAVPSQSVPRPGHIPGAVNLPWKCTGTAGDVPVLKPIEELQRLHEEAGAKPGEEVVFTCRSGMSASLGYFVAKYLGYNPRLYDGSFSQWSAAEGTEVEKTAGTIQVKVREPGQKGLLPCRAWVDFGGDRYFEPATQGCIPYARDRSFSCGGAFSIEVAPGDVVVHIERGKEYFAIERTVKVEPGETATVDIELRRWIHMVEEGWYSADWHVHFGVKDVEVMKQQALADDVNVLPVLGLWNENQPDWPFPPDQAVVRAGDRYIVTRRNQEIERIGGGPFESVGAPLIYGLTRPVHVPRIEHTFPPDVDLVRLARSHSPNCLVDTDKPSWGENVVTAAFGLFDTAQLCHNHYNRGRTMPQGWGMAEPEPAPSPIEQSDDELFWRTNDIYYRWLNLGFRLAATGGSAMGVMPTPLGYSRTYAKLDGPLTEENYIKAVRAGRTFATSGPILLLTVDGHGPGATIERRSTDGKSLVVEAVLRSIQPIGSLEIVHDGRIVKAIDLAGRRASPVLEETIQVEVKPARSGWVAARAIFREPGGHLRQAHTSPVYVTVDGKPIVSKADAEYMIRWIDELMEVSRRAERYNSEADRQVAQERFTEARAVYERLARTAAETWGD